jgi:WD40 repeat protein
MASRKKTLLDLVRCSFSPDARILAGLNTNDEMELWSLAKDQPRRISAIDNAGLFRHNTDLAFSPDSSTIVSVTTNGEVAIWTLTGEVPRLVRTLTNTPASRIAPFFSPDGKLLAICSVTDEASIWNWRAGSRITSLKEEGPRKHIEFCSFSPDGRILFTKYEHDSIRLWNTTDWAQGELIPNDPLQVQAISLDSHWLATGSGLYPKLKLWDLVAHKVEELPSGSGSIDCLAFSPDRRTLAVGTMDGWVNLWHLPSRQQIISIKAHRSEASRAVFSPDGRILATTGIDGNLRLWTAPTLAEADAR